MSDNRKTILAIAARRKAVRSAELVKALGLSRKTVAAHLKKLVEAGRLTKTGSTRNAVYRIPKGRPRVTQKTIRLIKKLKHVTEHAVFSEVDLRLALSKELSERAHGIANYAFTEMFNNAIDHSQSRKADVIAKVKGSRFEFRIRDFGVGLFKNIESKFKLEDEFAAVEHVLKGKQTTMPSRHSGEGLFFTSRIADRFSIRSHKLVLSIDNEGKDHSLGEKRFLRGTEIKFSIKKQTRRDLKALFDQYSNDDFAFDKTEVRVNLHAEKALMSRSSARRICHGLDAFQRVVLDFNGVKEVGQAFADEIFRVFAGQNPEIQISFQNANRVVEFMIMRAIRASH